VSVSSRRLPSRALLPLMRGRWVFVMGRTLLIATAREHRRRGDSAVGPEANLV